MSISKIKIILELEKKLILRNKRVKSILGVALLSTFYFLFTFNSNFISSFFDNIFLIPVIFIFYSYFLGFLMLSYGQFTLTWESCYSNLFFTSFFEKNEFIISKYYSLTILNLLSSILILCMVCIIRFDYLTISFLLTSIFYNTGVNIFIILFFSRFNKVFADLNEDNVANYDIVNSYQFISLFISFTISYGAYFLLYNLFENHYVVLSILSFIGIIGIILHKKILKKIYHLILISKYNLLEAYNTENE